MKKIVQLMLMALLFSFFTNTFAQIMMDKDDADWADVPILFEAPDNLDGVFPTEVGAVVTDIVDIKEAKVVVVDNVMFGLLRFWGGPAWPNNAYQNDHDGTIYPESRGYYHFLIDVDNDVTTGWKTSWYEAHYTPVGYLESLGQDVAPIGAEIMQEWGARTNDKWKQLNDSVAYARGLDHWAADYSEYDGQTDLGDDYEIFNISVPDPDSAKIVNWEGAAKVNSSDDESLVSDYYSYWIGHAWGNDFLEFGFELTPLQKYFANKGMSVLNPGDVIGICGMTETPIDDWGVDMTTRGELSVITGVNEGRNQLMVDKFELSNNYPNPFNPETVIRFDLTRSSQTVLKVFDLTGREVAVLVNRRLEPGTYQYTFTASNLPSGVYLYSVYADGFSETKRMVLVK